MVILARGLGLLHLITNLLHFYDAAGNNLVLVVGADDRENEWIGEGRLGRLRDCELFDAHIGFKALAEHYATSKSPLARGLKVINTEKATVSMRWVSRYMSAMSEALLIIALENESMRKVVF